MVRMLLVAMVMLVLFVSPTRAEKIKLEGVVNLNTATPDELRLIPGVGPARVRNILAYRRAHPFRTVDELARIKGIGRKTIRHWRMHLAVGGPSTAQRVLRPDSPEVGPAQLPAPAATAPKLPHPPLRPAAPVRPLRPLPRRGEPAHAFSLHAAGNGCLPPP
jgi:competence ComEA-like helix-hairpin-helix protein